MYKDPRPIILSRRELQVLTAIAFDDKSPHDIAIELGTTHSTVKNQLHSIYVKLGISSPGRPNGLSLARAVIWWWRCENASTTARLQTDTHHPASEPEEKSDPS